MTKLKEKPFALVGVNIWDYDAEKLKEIMDKEKLNWRSTSDAAKTIATDWNQPGTPLYYILDPQGVIRYKWLGYPGEQALDRALEHLIQTAEQGGKETPK